MTFAIHTFGCKVNTYESEYIINIMENNGYTLVDFKSNSDIYIINTCSVTNEADRKDRQFINSIRLNHPNSILIVMGCYSQLNSEKIDADIILGNK
jgi:threonylcarbamoyladenosine tRNA methylthiotransferase MtaB